MSLGICAVCGYEKGIGECELCALRSKVNQLGKELYEEHHRFLAENKKRVYLFDRLNEVAGENANLRAQLTAAEARVKELEQGFREVLVCARNISEGYYEDAALLGRIARSFLVGRCTGAISHAVFVQRKLRKGGGCAKPTKQ